jgi:N-acetylmuramoyl-L-alanine amidase
LSGFRHVLIKCSYVYTTIGYATFLRLLSGRHTYSDRFSGYSLFVSRDNPFPGRSLQCASAIGAALQARGYPPSYYHAEPIPGENRPFADRANGVHYYDQLVVLHTAKQPAVLIEAGVIVNRESEQILAMPETRENIAQAVAEGIANCLTGPTEAQ